MSSMKCPKCGHANKRNSEECSGCGVIFAKLEMQIEKNKWEKEKRRQEALERVEKSKLIIENAILTGDWSKVPKEKIKQALSRIIVTTSFDVPGGRTVRAVDIISAEVALGMNFAQEWFTSLSDTFGGRSKTTQSVLQDGRKKAVEELRFEALKLGANAVTGINLNYSQFSGKNKSMLFVVAYGTAVIVMRKVKKNVLISQKS
ncbi:heavy metal-binding domain-containing protein [Desulfococcaceae bacterium HSG9]|nr:heavy metal-binding domain-containing protein [Desulfococcaceae bacterium HSG9]